MDSQNSFEEGGNPLPVAVLAPKLQFFDEDDQVLEEMAQDKTQEPQLQPSQQKPLTQHSSKTSKTTLRSVYKEPIGDYTKKVDLS
jgi:hypothetical protein